MQKNCWEFMNCGREKTNDCPAYPEYGRKCWWVAGTKCKGITQGTFAEKYENCNQCPWFRRLEAEESGLAQEKEILPAENCWEFWSCGKDKSGGCPAFPNKGQQCWLVAGTECMGEIRGTFAKVFAGKLKSCHDCPWHLNLTDRVFTVMKSKSEEPAS